jgi:hypothetical protein
MLVQVKDLGARRITRCSQELFSHGLVSVEGPRSHVLYDEDDVVFTGEGVEICREKEVSALARNRSPDEKEAEPFLCRKGIRFKTLLKDIRVHAVRNDWGLIVAESSAEESILHVAGKAPDVIYPVAEGIYPGEGQTAILPGLSQNPATRGGWLEGGWPVVADMDIDGSLRIGVKKVL